MATVKSNSMPIWTADVKQEPRFIPIAGRTPEGDVEETPQKETGVSFIRVWDCFVDVFRPGCERIRFRVNHRKGRCITFTDRRGTRRDGRRHRDLEHAAGDAGGQATHLDPDRLPGGSGSADRSGAGRRNRPGDYGEIFFGVANDICQTKCVAAEREA